MDQSNVCPTHTGRGSGRLLALDALRGLSVASMIAVISPGRYDHVFSALTHAAWVGTPYADMIFPAFLVAVGVAMTLSFAKRVECGASAATLLRRSGLRSVALVVLGLALNFYIDPHFSTVRLPGVLQRIGICYLGGALLYIPLREMLPGNSTSERWKRLLVLAGGIAVLLTVYGCLLRFVPVPGFGTGHLDSNGNLGAWLDRRIFTVPHLWPYGTTPGVGVTFDPEGLLSSIPALGTLLMGVLAGELLHAPEPLARRIRSVATAGTGFLLLAFVLEPFVPFIKKIWTPSFACFSGGVALLALAALLWIIDLRRSTKWSVPLRIFGTNAILAFTISWLIMGALFRLPLATNPASYWLYDHLFAAPWLDSRVSALGYAALIVCVNLLLLVPFYRRQWFLRI